MKREELFLRKEEQVLFRLRALFEQYGYNKFKMSKFEEYDFYSDNRRFMNSENILTFTGMNGKLLALKPDITLSIVKTTKANRTFADKVYYTENVYRAPKGANEFKEIMQAGLEYIGEVDSYAEMEVLELAQKSLEATGQDYLISLSHMGFVTGLMEEANLNITQQKKLLHYISKKSIHGVKALCEDANVSDEMSQKLQSLAGLYGSLEKMLPKIKAMSCNDKTSDAVNELENIYTCLKAFGSENSFYLDFSIVNDMDYYTGIIFQGYIEGVASAILSGGRYDNLVHKLGKDADAIGFAVALDLLERLQTEEKEYDVDTLLLYDEDTDTIALAKAAQMLRNNGQTVLTSRNNNGNIKYKQLLHMKERGLEIVTEAN